jgi:glycosyltransferase involved in cell wall biosynthesis
MRIAIVASNWRPLTNDDKNIFAPGTIIVTLADGLVDNGHEVTLFAPVGTKTKAKLISEGLNAASEDYYDLWQEDPASFYHVQLQYELNLISKAFEMAQNNEFDVIQIHKTNIEIYFSNFAKCPVVVSAHSSYNEGMTKHFSAADEARLKKYEKSCFYTAPSEFIKNQVDFKHIKVVNHGLDEQTFKFAPDGGKNMLYTGRLIARKGVDLAIDVALLANKKLDVIGDIRPTQIHQDFWLQLKDKISSNNEIIEYIGCKSYEEMPVYFQNAKLLVYPIRQPETFGLVLIEAMACGTPIVAFNIGPVKEIVQDGVTGFLCEPGDTKKMAELVNKIYNMPEAEYRQMRKNCRAIVEAKFTNEKMVQAYEDYFKYAIEEYSSN